MCAEGRAREVGAKLMGPEDCELRISDTGLFTLLGVWFCSDLILTVYCFPFGIRNYISCLLFYRSPQLRDKRS